MTTESQQQIAQEAAEEQWPWLPPKSAQVQKTKQIILSAIERANGKPSPPPEVEPDQPQFTDAQPQRRHHSKDRDMNKPQRSEQQEWTKRQYIDKMSGRPRDSWDIYEGRRIIVGDLAEEECDKLCDAHNAALKQMLKMVEALEWISSECGREAGLKADDTLFEIREGK